jgi:cell division protein FtsX
MRTRSHKLLLVCFVLVLCVVGFGFYNGWWSLSSSTSPDGDSNKVDVNLSVNPDKMKEDAETVKEKAKEATGQAEEKSDETSGQTEEEKATADGQS